MIKNIVILIIIFIALIYDCNAEEVKLNCASSEPVTYIGPVFGEKSWTSKMILDLIFLKLIDYEEDGKIVSDLLEGEFDINFKNTYQNSNKITFTLKKNVYWNEFGVNNKPITADDVIFTYRAIKKSDSGNEKVYYIDYISKSTEDSLKFTVHYEPNVKFFEKLYALNFYLLPAYADYGQINGDEYIYILNEKSGFFNDKPIGCGKYYCDARTNSGAIELIRNIKFINNLIIDKLPYQFMHKAEYNQNNLIKLVNDNKYNFVLDVPVALTKDFQDELSGKGKLIPKTRNSWQMMAFNLRREKCKDRNLRLLFQYTINKEQINRTALNGEALVLQGPFVSGSMDFDGNPEYKSPKPDIGISIEDLAKQLGYEILEDEKGKKQMYKKNEKVEKFKLIYRSSGDISSNMDDCNIATHIKSQIEGELGIEIDILGAMDYDEIIFEKRDFDLALVEFVNGIDPSVYTIFHSDFNKPGGLNVCGLEDTLIDEKLEMGLDLEYIERFKLYAKQQELIGDKLPGIFLFNKPFSVFVNTDQLDVEDFEINIRSIFKDIEYWTK